MKKEDKKNMTSAVAITAQDCFFDQYKSAKSDEDRQDAAWHIVESNEKLIWKIINQKFGAFGGYKEDLLQEGRIGLLKAIPKYDPEKGAHTTFFYPYIVHEISRYISEFIQGTSTHYSEKIVALKRASNSLEKNGVEVTILNLHAETGIPIETITRCLQMDRMRSSAISIDSDEFTDANENTADSGMLSPEEELIMKEKTEIVEDCVCKDLTEEERLCVCYKYGILGYPALSHSDISRTTGIALNRVRSCVYSAERKLKKSKMAGYNKDIEQSKYNISTVPVALAMQQVSDMEEAFGDFDNFISNI